MTIRSARRPVLALGAAMAGLSAVMTVSALIAARAILLFLAPVVVLQAVLVISWLLPKSLSVEGSELVYRAGRREKRVARGDVARCALVRSTWIFSNAAGAQVLTLPTPQFIDKDVAAFCTQTGITIESAQPTVDKLRKAVTSAKWTIALGIFVASTMFAVAGLFLVIHIEVQADFARYLASSVCEQPPPKGTNCRFEAQARVVSVDTQSRHYATLHLTLVESNGDYTTDLPYPSPKAGDVVGVQLWSGRVTLVNGRATNDNVTTNSNLNNEGGIAVFVLWALGGIAIVGVGVYQLVTARAKLRAASASGAPTKGVQPSSGVPPAR